MTTYTVRCRNSTCRHRRISAVHPFEYKRTFKCPVCSSTKGWRIEKRAVTRSDLICNCSGPEGSQEEGKNYPHKKTHPMCDHHPRGIYNQLKRAGVPDADIPLQFLGVPIAEDDETIPF